MNPNDERRRALPRQFSERASSRPGAQPRGEVRDAMRLKLAIGSEKIRSAIAADGGTTVYGAHLLPHCVPFLPALIESGMKILEITHGSLYLAKNPPRTRVHEGGRYEALKASYGVPVEELAAKIREIRPALGDIFLNVGAPGTFNQIGPTFFTDESAFLLSQAGADGIHTHQSNLEELAEIVDRAHRYGLLVEGYINRWLGPTHPFSYMGIPAETPSQVATAARDMDRIGVDIVGLMFSADPQYYSQAGASDELPAEVRERLRALRRATDLPISVEGQITPQNAQEIHRLGGNILVLGSVFDIAIEDAIKKVVADFSTARGG